jgi:hypothetical protein
MKAWKLQKFFGDVVYDLRNRGLLPVVVLLLIAMVAIPVVISRGASSSGPSLQPAGATAESVPEAQQAVVSYSPGVREYKKRLQGLEAKDPFHQQFAAAAAAAGQLTGTDVGATGSADTTGATGSPITSSGSGTGSTESTGSTGGSKKKKKKKSSSGAYTYQTDLAAGESSATLTPFTNVAPMTTLPSATAQVLIYFGNTADNLSSLFLVSNKVTQVSGQGVCLPNPDDCALLSLSAGQTEDLVYAGDGKTYRVQVVRIVKHFTK